MRRLKAPYFPLMVKRHQVLMDLLFFSSNLVHCKKGSNICYSLFLSNLITTSNPTIVALVSKRKNPNSMKDFKHISYCSVIYKCIIKIQANILQKYLPNIIGNNQCAFTTRMTILDNILMA